MLPLENESVEIQRDARLFFRLIRKGKMSLEQARADILVSDQQAEMLADNHTPMMINGIVGRRIRAWNCLLRLLEADAAARPAPRRAKAASAAS